MGGTSPTVIINTKGGVQDTKPYVMLLEENGFDVHVAADPRFGLGLNSDEEVIDLLRGASAVIAGATPYPANVIDKLPDLRVLARSGVGFDKVDLDAATANNVVVTITPNSNFEAVSEHAMALILALAKSVVTADKKMRHGHWPNRSRKPIRGSTLGIVGLGRIGKSLAVRAQAMKMRVIACEEIPDRVFVEKHGIELVGLETLLGRADYVSLHCPLTDDTHGFINRDMLELMKPEASIVNTARGGLIVEADLVEVLRSEGIDSAGLDVFENEPISPDHPLHSLDNVILSPHIAGSDHLSRKEMGLEAANCIIELSRGRWPSGSVVNNNLEGKWTW